MDARQERELLRRITVMEEKIDALAAAVDRATGAWMFIKILGSLSLGIAAIWAFIASHFTTK
jgi:hypothetical protein